MAEGAIEGKEGIVESVRALTKRCSSIVNAGDPDDEGQLLVDELIDYIATAAQSGEFSSTTISLRISGEPSRTCRPND